MLCKLYAGTKNSIDAGNIGTLKMARIHKNEIVTDTDYKKALQTTLYSDIQFLMTRMGTIHEVFARTANLKNTLIMIQHTNRCISHIAINFDNDNQSTPIYRVEIVGDSGLIDYDSSRDAAVRSGSNLNQTTKPDWSAIEHQIQTDNNKTVHDIITGIMRSLTEGKPVQFATESMGGGQN